MLTVKSTVILVYQDIPVAIEDFLYYARSFSVHLSNMGASHVIGNGVFELLVLHFATFVRGGLERPPLTLPPPRPPPPSQGTELNTIEELGGQNYT